MVRRVILHADMDAFYASVEQRDHPHLRGLPVIVGGEGPRGVVATASYEARRFGVRSAMPGVEARRRCPEGVFVRPRMHVYQAVSRQVREIFESFTPEIEPLSLDEAFLDVTGSQRLLGDGATMARALKDAVRETVDLTVSVGVAPSKYAAKVASDLQKPDGLVVVPDDVAAFLAPLPVSRLWGAGPKTQRRLRALGLETIGDVAGGDRDRLVAALGARTADHFRALALGDDPRPVISARDPKSVSHETTFARDIEHREELHRVLFELSEMVGRRLRRHGLASRCVRVKVRWGDFVTRSRQRAVAQLDADRALADVARALFDELWDGRGVRLLGVVAAELQAVGAGAAEGAPRQGQLFAPEAEVETVDPRRDALQSAMDRIRDRFGESAIRHGAAGRTVAEDRDRISEVDPS